VCVCVCVSTVFYHFDRKANLCNCKYMLLDTGYSMKHDDPIPSATWIQILPNFRFIEFVNHTSGVVSVRIVSAWGLVPAETPD
jgi:hypothetical protein